MIKARVIKLQNISNKDETNMYVRTGDVFEGQIMTWPEIGESFYLWDGKACYDFSNQYVLRTTPITELIGDREFKTLNSIYKIVTKEDERDERIKIILQ
jgi:hypothetical protein